jgi:hypothetical protein
MVSSGGDVLDASHEALRTAVPAVPADGRHLPTPCAAWSVAQVFQHAVGDQIGYAAALTGEPGPTSTRLMSAAEAPALARARDHRGRLAGTRPVTAHQPRRSRRRTSMMRAGSGRSH